MKDGGTNIWVGAEIHQELGKDIWIPLIRITAPDTDKEVTFMADVHLHSEDECRKFCVSLAALFTSRPNRSSYDRNGGLPGKG